MAPNREPINCAHLLDSLPREERRTAELVIDLGDNRQVVLCDPCAAKASMDVVKELIRGLQPNVPEWAMR